jgi:serine/threonine protein kinase
MGEYEIVDYIQTGAFGLIFSGRHYRSGRSVAIKILRMDATTIARGELENEDAILQKVSRNAPNVIRRRASGDEKILMETSGNVVTVRVPYLILDLATCSIEDLLPRREDLSWPERLNLLHGIAKGLHQLHKAGIVHRDVKSSNGLVFVTGETSTSVLSDLGRARDLAQESIRPGNEYSAGMGDYRFAPPEALYLQMYDSPEVWRLADIYGIGSLLFELATGQGITSFALGSGQRIVRALEQMSPYLRKSHYEARLSEIRGAYAEALDFFAGQVPECIADQSIALLRQLCDPDPRRRDHTPVAGTADPGLDWLVKRVRVMALKARLADRSKCAGTTGEEWGDAV